MTGKWRIEGGDLFFNGKFRGEGKDPILGGGSKKYLKFPELCDKFTILDLGPTFRGVLKLD